MMKLNAQVCSETGNLSPLLSQPQSDPQFQPPSLSPQPSQSISTSSSSFIDDMPQWKYSFYGSIFGLSDEECSYQKHMSKENSFRTWLVLTFVTTIITLTSITVVILGNFSSGFKMFVAQRVFILVSVWFHFYAIFQRKFPNWKPLPVNIIYIGDLVLVSFSFAYGLYIYGLATADGCDNPHHHPSLMCGKRLHADSILAYVTISMMFSVLVKCRHMGAVIVSILVQTFFLIFIVITIEPTMANAMALIVVFFAQSFVAFDCDTYSRRLYLHLTQSHAIWKAKVEADNENVVMEMQSTELRFLIGNVAHDLKTPLQAFSYELEVLKKSPAMSNSASGKESLMLLESVCSFMLMTINRAIDYTKVTSGIKLKPSLATVDVKGVFEWVKKCVSHTDSTNRSVPIVVEPFSPDICQCIITDEQWLMENLLCLISNAQKFTARGNIVVRYSLCTDVSNENVKAVSIEYGANETMEVARNNTEKQKVFTDEDTPINAAKTVVPLQYDISDVQPPLMVMVEVLDEGIGISEEMQRTLFKPFKQAMRRAGGTGLGIYSLSKRVESLGGKCGVSSRSDGKSGARFWFTLPYKPDDSAVAFLNNEPALSSIPTGSTDALQDVIENNGSSASDNHYIEEAGVSILLVEDSLLIQKTCTRAFQREGIVIDVANNGLECLEKVLQAMHGFKVLLMDVNMPLMDGLEATKRIREWERERGGDESGGGDKSVSSCSRLVIIGLSANSDSESTQEALDAGMDRFIGKPLKMSVLRECLADFDLALDSFKTVCDSKKF